MTKDIPQNIERIAIDAKFIKSPGDIPDFVNPLVDKTIGNAINGHDAVLLDNGWFLTSAPSDKEFLQLFQRVSQMRAAAKLDLKLIRAERNVIEILNSSIREEVSQGHDSRAETFVNELITKAIENSWTDIHIQFRNRMTEVWVRADGVRELHEEIPNSLSMTVRNFICNWEADSFDGHLNVYTPQDGSMDIKVKNEPVSLRIATWPEKNGQQDMVLRVSRDSKGHLITLNDLGFGKTHLAIFREAIRQPQGAIIVSGPTGSGKSTTLAAAISEIPLTKRIVTVEDPIEIPLPNASQSSVDDRNPELTFIALARASLRVDPDVIMLGEIRDNESAFVGMRAATTGHLLFSTLHTNRAVSIPDTLTDLGVSRARLIDPSLLLLLVSQRLAPKLCTQCRMPFPEFKALSHTNDEMLRRLILHSNYFESHDIDMDRLFYRRPKGCEQCDHAGHHGRIAVLEMIRMDDAGIRFIANDDKTGWIEYLRSLGWEDYQDHARHLVKRGLLDAFSAESAVGSFNRGANEYSYQQVLDSVRRFN